MKHANTYASIILSLFCTTAFALEGSDCLKQSEKLPETKRQSFMESCLNKAQSPENTQEVERKKKSAECAQNAKNKGLGGNSKAQYESDCMNKNEAVAVQKKPANKTTLPELLGNDTKPSPNSGKATHPSSKKPQAKKHQKSE